MLISGRVVIVEHLPQYTPRFGVILETIPLKTNPPNRIRVLILTSSLDGRSLQEQGFEMSNILGEELMAMEEIKNNFELEFSHMLYLSHRDLVRFNPEINVGYFHHAVIEVEYNQILGLVHKLIRVDSESILSDIRKRENPRFRYVISSFLIVLSVLLFQLL